MKNIETLQGEIKQNQLEKSNVEELKRKSDVKLMEKSAEFTARMSELLNMKGNSLQFLTFIIDERDKHKKLAQMAEKRLKDTKKVSFYL